MTTMLPRDSDEADDGVVIHSMAEFREMFGSVLELLDDPPGPLNRAQFALFKRSRGVWLGNLISTVRYWMWRISR